MPRKCDTALDGAARVILGGLGAGPTGQSTLDRRGQRHEPT